MRSIRVSGVPRDSSAAEAFAGCSSLGTALANALNSLRASRSCVPGGCCVSCVWWPSPNCRVMTARFNLSE